MVATNADCADMVPVVIAKCQCVRKATSSEEMPEVRALRRN